MDRAAALVATALNVAGIPASRTVTMVNGSISLDRIKVLPLKPLWPGFAINTTISAAIMRLLLASPLALRRRIRIKRGQCPKCAYDLPGSASATCPECGSAVRANTT